MAEPVSLTFSLLALGRTAAQVAKSLFNFGKTISDAKARINQLATEVDLFAVLPNTLASLLKEDGSPFGPQLLKDTDNQLQDCHTILNDIQKEMGGIDPKSPTAISRAKWYFREETVNLLRSRLEAAKTSLTLRVVILNLAASLKWRQESVKQHYKEAARLFDSDQISIDRTSEWVAAGHGHRGQSSTNSSTKAGSSSNASVRRQGSNTGGMRSHEAVRFLLAAWTNVKDTSSLPGDLSYVTRSEPLANDARHPAQRGKADLSASSSRSSSISRQYDSQFPWKEPQTPFSECSPHDRFGPQAVTQKAGIEMGTIRVEYFGGRESPSVPVACMPLLSWENSEHFWIRQFASHALLNFAVRYKSFFHYIAIPHHAARFWQDQRTLSGKILGVHTLLSKVCHRLAGAYRELIEFSDPYPGQRSSIELHNQIEDARKATTRIQDFRFNMHCSKRSQHEANEAHATDRRRIELWNWDSEIATGYLDPSRYYITIEFPDGHLHQRRHAQGMTKAVLPNTCRNHQAGRRGHAHYQRGYGVSDLGQAYMNMSNCNVYL